MSEIMRWRLTRAPQKRVPAGNTLVALDEPKSLSTDRKTLHAIASNIVTPTQFHAQLIGAGGTVTESATAPTNAFAGLYYLDRWLTSVDNRPAPSDLKAQIDALLGAFLPNSINWQTTRDQINSYLYQFLLVQSATNNSKAPDTGVLMMRFRLVIALVDSFEADATQFATADDVYNALHWRLLLLPETITSELETLRQKNRPVLVRRPAFADLYVTREEWNRYEAAEIATIENILGRETKSRVHILVNETTQTTVTDQSTTTTKEQDTTTTDTTQLQQQSSADISIAAHVDAQVDVSAQYGPTQIQAHAGGSLDYSNHSATQKATTQAHETVARAVNKVVQSTRNVRTTSTMTKSKDKELHKFDNAQSADPVVGVYRWVDKVQRVELDRYPHRFLLEFELPEPGAWTRWLHRNDVARQLINKPPKPFTFTGDPNGGPLEPIHITAQFLPELIARYMATGLGPSPLDQQTVATNITFPDTSASASSNDRIPLVYKSDTSITVPNGYFVISSAASVLANGIGDTSDHNKFESNVALIKIAIGAGPAIVVQASDINAGVAQVISNSVGPISQGTVPIAIEAQSVVGYSINVEVVCAPNNALLAQWQQDCYDQLVGAYNDLLGKYNDELAGLSVAQKNIVDLYSPTQNKRIVMQELKRQVIEMLTGKKFMGRPAIQWTNADLPPATELDVAAHVAPEIQFLEQAFEWENLTYIFYPYYWGDSTRWADLATIIGDDDDFADFLRAGSARVVLPARPGFEDQVNFYCKYGIIWGGGPVPVPGDVDYLSIADEIRAQQQRPLDVTVVDAWEVRLPTTLIWLENPAGLPHNENPTITVT